MAAGVAWPAGRPAGPEDAQVRLSMENQQARPPAAQRSPGQAGASTAISARCYAGEEHCGASAPG